MQTSKLWSSTLAVYRTSDTTKGLPVLLRLPVAYICSISLETFATKQENTLLNMLGKDLVARQNQHRVKQIVQNLHAVQRITTDNIVPE